MRIPALAGLALIFAQSVWSAEKTVVLQNGLDGYNGCTDSYITTISSVVESGTDPRNANKSDDVELFARNCPA